MNKNKEKLDELSSSLNDWNFDNEENYYNYEELEKRIDGFDIPKTIYCDCLNVDKIFSIDKIYLNSKDSDTFKWACDETYQNSEEKLNIMINSIPKIN